MASATVVAGDADARYGLKLVAAASATGNVVVVAATGLGVGTLGCAGGSVIGAEAWPPKPRDASGAPSTRKRQVIWRRNQNLRRLNTTCVTDNQRRNFENGVYLARFPKIKSPSSPHLTFVSPSPYSSQPSLVYAVFLCLPVSSSSFGGAVGFGCGEGSSVRTGNTAASDSTRGGAGGWSCAKVVGRRFRYPRR